MDAENRGHWFGRKSRAVSGLGLALLLVIEYLAANSGDGDLRIRDRRSVLATLAQLVDSGVNRKILHDSRRLLLPGIRDLYRLLALEDQRKLRQKLGHWHAGFRSLASNLLAGLESTRLRQMWSTH